VLWKATRSTRPARTSWVNDCGCFNAAFLTIVPIAVCAWGACAPPSQPSRTNCIAPVHRPFARRKVSRLQPSGYSRFRRRIPGSSGRSAARYGRNTRNSP
jgi:hypothetical protein